MTAEYTVVEETTGHRILIRAWQPGDGLICSFSKRAPRERPCGRPVAVTITQDLRPCWRSWCRDSARECDCGRRTRRLVCANHIPSLASPGAISVEARKKATERLLVEQWDTWQRYVKELTDEAVAQQFAGLDPEIVRIILASPENSDAA